MCLNFQSTKTNVSLGAFSPKIPVNMTNIKMSVTLLCTTSTIFNRVTVRNRQFLIIIYFKRNIYFKPNLSGQCSYYFEKKTFGSSSLHINSFCPFIKNDLQRRSRTPWFWTFSIQKLFCLWYRNDHFWYM